MAVGFYKRLVANPDGPDHCIEWDAAHGRLEQEWLAAYTAAFVEIAISRGWRRDVPRS
jgi:hypothetical protein